MTESDLIEQHRAAVARFQAAPYGTPEFYAADIALAASFNKLADRLAEEDEECTFLRPQAI